MQVYTALIKKQIAESIWDSISQLEIEKYVDQTESEAIAVLAEIQKILMNETDDDFEKIEKIVLLFERNGLDCGGCHDFS